MKDCMVRMRGTGVVGHDEKLPGIQRTPLEPLAVEQIPASLTGGDQQPGIAKNRFCPSRDACGGGPHQERSFCFLVVRLVGSLPPLVLSAAVASCIIPERSIACY